MAGLLFGMAGWYKVFVMTAAKHAQGMFVEGFAVTWIPIWILWPLGWVIPFVELIGGLLLVVGWQRRPVALVLGVLLLIVTYGHTLKDPFYDITTHVLPRLILLAPALLLAADRDTWSLDGWLARRRIGS